MNKTVITLIISFFSLLSGNQCPAQGSAFPEGYEKTDRTPVLPVNDTIRKNAERVLNSVTVTAQQINTINGNVRYSAGTKMFAGSAQIIGEMRMNSLADFLRREHPVYIKEYGNGMGSYISVRGTSSSHTRIEWNGSNMAMPTIGQSDLSHIPVFFFDRVEYHPGGGSSLYGDGSIGGSILLNTSPNWKKGISGDLLLSAGSYGSAFTGVNIRYSKNRFESRSSFLYTTSRNDYSFINNTKTGLPKEYLNNSSVSNIGFLQELFRKFRDSSTLSATLLYMNFDRQIQPPVSLNDIPSSHESIHDKNIKFNISYQGRKDLWRYKGALSFAGDKELFREDLIAANTFSAMAEGEYLRESISVKVGSSARKVIPQVYSYSGSGEENRIDLYLLARYSPDYAFAITAGIRKSLVTDVSVPLMPSLDARYLLYSRGSNSLTVRGSLSGSSRIPTLNDRYWGGENIYLKSEHSFTGESGLDYTYSNGRLKAEIYATGYRSLVRDWIRWLPAGVVWKPQNIPLVLSSGAEAGGKISVVKGDYTISLTSSLSYTSIVTKEGLWAEDPSVGRQMAYQPRLSVRSGIRGESKNTSLYLLFSFTGKRTTTDIFDLLPSYFLTDAGVNRSFSMIGRKFEASAVVRNIFNVRYQNVKFYAMPGRNFQFSLKWKFGTE